MAATARSFATTQSARPQSRRLPDRRRGQSRSRWTDCRALLAGHGKTAIVTENVMPSFGVLNIEPARARDPRRVHRSHRARQGHRPRRRRRSMRVLMPTPAAVMEGARLLADGCVRPRRARDLAGRRPRRRHDRRAFGIASGEPSRATASFRTACRSRASSARSKATSACATTSPARSSKQRVLGAIAPASGLAADRASQEPARRDRADVGARCRQSADEAALDDALARAAVRLAVRRHAGTREDRVHRAGPVIVQTRQGSDRRDHRDRHRRPLAHGPDPGRRSCEAALADGRDAASAAPAAPRLLVDRDYLLYACGLLATVEPELAWRSRPCTSLQRVDNEASHGPCTKPREAKPQLSAARIADDDFERMRRENLARWPTGALVDMDEAVA